MKSIEVTRADCPLVLSFPHTGTDIPDEVTNQLNDKGLALADTDWHIHRLYDGLLEDVTTVRTKIHRYVIDVNRDPGGKSLYPGQNTTSLCPVTDFDGAPIYLEGMEPDAEEIRNRCEQFHRPYHAALETELERVLKIFGFVILYDCHSIRSRIPFLFDGKLPDFSIGTNDGLSCVAEIEAVIVAICGSAREYSYVLNGRFKGGWTTRHYANPQVGIHCVQMELAQSTYIDEIPPWAYHRDKAAGVRVHLGKILASLSNWRPL